ncbi:hypothetical protein [Pectobacterium sp. B2J-2]|uniref:hypothetical protein n=1 Tax=Pectobacterium sp. B2J-2 TaxID=3385372 RepID=UPI0038FBEBEC
MSIKINNSLVERVKHFALVILKNTHALIVKVFDAKIFYLGASVIILSVFISPILDVLEHESRYEKALYSVFKILLTCLFWYGVAIILIAFFIYKKRK